MANRIDIDIDRVEKLAAQGLSEQQIADCLGISRSTIDRRKRDDDAFVAALKRGKHRGIENVTNALYEAATAGDKPNVSAMIFYLKNRAGWRDRADISADITADATLSLDIEAALDALREAGIDPSKL
jgi:transcriptional regulator with XRE-family HTH domain